MCLSRWQSEQECGVHLQDQLVGVVPTEEENIENHSETPLLRFHTFSPFLPEDSAFLAVRLARLPLPLSDSASSVERSVRLGEGVRVL